MAGNGKVGGTCNAKRVNRAMQQRSIDPFDLCLSSLDDSARAVTADHRDNMRERRPLLYCTTVQYVYCSWVHSTRSHRTKRTSKKERSTKINRINLGKLLLENTVQYIITLR